MTRIRTPHSVAVTWSTTTDGLHYAISFKESADAVIHRGIEDHRQDLVLFPALYCYRHGLELTLKAIIYLGQRVRGESREVWKTHKLTELWPRARSVMQEAFPRDDGLDALEALVLELAAIDFTGELFRYAHDRDGRAWTLPPELARVDLLHVRRLMDKLFGQLFGAIDGIDYMLDAMPDESDYY
jgi:hypothetical protein